MGMENLAIEVLNKQLAEAQRLVNYRSELLQRVRREYALAAQNFAEAEKLIADLTAAIATVAKADKLRRLYGGTDPRTVIGGDA